MLAYYLHEMDPFIFHLGANIGPRWYGMAYVMAFLCSYALFLWFAKHGYSELRPEQVGDLVSWTALFGVLVGGRVGYVLFYHPEMLREPFSVFRVWEGGMSSHGGILGIVVFTFFYARWHHLSWMDIGDNFVVTAPIGLFFGRCANFINGELYGRVTTVPWAMLFPKELLDPANAAEADRAVAVAHQIDPTLTTPEAVVAGIRTHPQLREALHTILTPRHPSQLYEALLEGLALFLVLWFVRTRLRPPRGVVTGLFFVCYAAFRIFGEMFREPDASMIGIFTRGQFFSLFMIAIGAAFIASAYRVHAVKTSA